MKKSWIGLSADLLVAAARPEGASIYQFEKWTPRQAIESFGSLRVAGRVIRVGNRNERRYFVHQADADRYAAELVRIRSEKKVALDARRHAIKKAARAAAAALRPPKQPKVKAAKAPKPKKVKAEKPAKAVKAKTAPNNPKKPAWSKPEPSVKFNNPKPGVHIPRYTGSKWDENTPAIIPPHVKVTVCPSPAEFGPAAKLRGIGV